MYLTTDDSLAWPINSLELNKLGLHLNVPLKYTGIWVCVSGYDGLVGFTLLFTSGYLHLDLSPFMQPCNFF